MSWEVLEGDCRDLMSVVLPAGKFDAIVTDPPYELTAARPGGRSEATRGAVMGGFMGMKWDGTGVAFDPVTWRLALALLKPGGHLLAFGGSRTYHRLACAIEDAGFEIRDQIMWIYGSGFPKSLNLDGSWQGWGTALKPAHEPIVVARKPLVGTVAGNVAAHGTGALNIDGCRVGTDVVGWGGGAAGGNTWDETNCGLAKGGDARPVIGRWPANIVHDGSDEVLAAFPEAPGQLVDASASSSSRKNQNTYGAMARGSAAGPARKDAGSAARFFYCAKASKADRGPGNTHPTVKPTALMRYLCRLVTPPGGRILDPFTGSGSTGRAAVLEGFDFTGIEREPEHVVIARARIAAVAPHELSTEELV